MGGSYCEGKDETLTIVSVNGALGRQGTDGKKIQSPWGKTGLWLKMRSSKKKRKKRIVRGVEKAKD